jgi:uncharacterized OB-fold protein
MGDAMKHEPPKEPITYVDKNMYLPFDYIAGDYRALYLKALKDKKILGSKCAKTGKVFVPPVRSSPESFSPATEFVEVADRGTVKTFCVVNIPVYGRDLELPYVCASVVLDGADQAIFALIQEVDVASVRMGMRVEAVWKPDGERQGDHTDILHFRPTGEPDVPLASLAGRG